MSLTVASFAPQLLARITEYTTILQGNFIELAIAFFVLAIIAGALGAGGVAGLSMRIAKILVAVFLILAVLSLLL